MAQLQVGEVAPDFKLEGVPEWVSLRGLCEKADAGVVVYFYPKASTPGCTTEACDFRDSLASLGGAGYLVVGVSPDKLPALEKFASNHSLSFPLASDPSHAMMEAWGAWGEKKNYGRVYQGVIRSTVIVGKDGKVSHAFYNVKAKGHVARIRKELGLD